MAVGLSPAAVNRSAHRKIVTMRDNDGGDRQRGNRRRSFGRTVRQVLAGLWFTSGRTRQRPERAERADLDGDRDGGLRHPVTYNRSTGMWSTRTGRGQLLQNTDRHRLIRSALAAEQPGPFRPPPLRDRSAEPNDG